MGQCLSSSSCIPPLSGSGLKNRFWGSGLKRGKITSTVTRRPGVVSDEAVQWFLERDQKTFQQSVSFVPWVVQRGIKMGSVSESTDSVEVYRGDGAVVFCDASGFTRLTEYLAQKPDGAELLSSVLNQFFTPLIDLINSYRGDIIKFSGDALTILFLAEPEENSDSDEHLVCGSGWARCAGHSDLELAVLRAAACCLEIHRRLDNFDTGMSDRTLSFHIGVGCGTCVVLHVGGECSPEDPKVARFEYVICGEPLEQIAHACHYAEVYETVLSPQAWKLIKDTAVEGSVIFQDPSYKKLEGLVTSKHTYATVRSAAQARDQRQEKFALKIPEMNVTRRYIPSAVFKQMENGTLEYVNEIRNVTVFFICVAGLDVSTPQGGLIAQDLMVSVQQACFEQEGQVNKFLVDDKGLLFLCVFGTPPMVHTDDPIRAIYACFSIIHSLKQLGLVGNFGLSSGRVFCGVVGSNARREYTTLGDSVNLAARFMQIGKPNVLLVDKETYDQTKNDLNYTVLDPVVLKGKANAIPVYQPHLKVAIGAAGAEDEHKELPSAVAMKLPSILEGAIVARPPSVKNTRRSMTIDMSSPHLQYNSLDLNGAGGARRGTKMGELIKMANHYSTIAASAAASLANDPLMECAQWKELKQMKRILEESGGINSAGGTIVLGGQSGLGKDQLCQQIITSALNTNQHTLIVYATDQGQPRDRARPVVELLETCISVASSCGLFTAADEQETKLVKLSKLIGVPLSEIEEGATLNDETGMIEIADLNNCVFTSSVTGLDTNHITARPALPNTPTPTITIGDASLSPSRGHNRRGSLSGNVGNHGVGHVPHEERFLTYCELIVTKLLQVRPMVVVLRSTRGTALFNIINNSTFWKLVQRISALSSRQSSGHTLTVALLCRRVEDAVDVLTPSAHRIELQPLTRNCIEEYVAKILRLEAEGSTNIPHELVEFVEDLTQGNPLYIMESLEQLVSHKHITRSSMGYVTVNTDLHTNVNVSTWSHTAMVGRVICQLEALAPQEAAIVKMASIFEGPFSVLDVAASLKSPYTNARRFDNYRMYRTCARLAKLGILSEIAHLPQTTNGESEYVFQVPVNDMSRFPKETDDGFLQSMNKIPMFILNNFLIRKVANGMILHQQALRVKRQAMMYRVIFKEVPQRIEQQRKRLAGLHTPYYNLVKL